MNDVINFLLAAIIWIISIHFRGKSSLILGHKSSHSLFRNGKTIINRKEIMHSIINEYLTSFAINIHAWCRHVLSFIGMSRHRNTEPPFRDRIRGRLDGFGTNAVVKNYFEHRKHRRRCIARRTIERIEAKPLAAYDTWCSRKSWKFIY